MKYLSIIFIFVILTVITMEISEIETYQSPRTVTIDALYEGGICSSNELLDETEGEW